jgi:hypothetical protein
MSKEWFSVAELRAAGLPSMDEDFFQHLAAEFYGVPESVCDRWMDGFRFHIGAFAPADQDALRRIFATFDPHEARLRRLGVWRAVKDPWGVYVGRVGEAELAVVEHRLGRRELTGA